MGFKVYGYGNFMTASASKTVPLIVNQLKGRAIDEEAPQIKVRDIDFATKDWPIEIAVTVDIDGLLGSKLWTAVFDNAGLEYASESETALSVATNIRALLREIVATGNMGDFRDI
jgi:hypothetical protein